MAALRLSQAAWLSPLTRGVLSDIKPAFQSIVIPVRTKKRFFIPPAIKAKYKQDVDREARARAAGVVLRQQYVERPINITCTAGIFDGYVPPEGDSRLTSMSSEGLKQRAMQIRQTAASQLAIRKVKEYDDGFSTKTFPTKVQDIYVEAHDCLVNFNKVRLHQLVTERCFPEMVRGNRLKTLRWRFLESLEPPRVVHVRCPKTIDPGNLYGQVTVRLLSKQTMALYDRFGRLMYGSEEVPKDVLEYVVFERHLPNPYGNWRLHGKIVPQWTKEKDPIIKTIMIPGPKLHPWTELDETMVEQKAPALQWYK
ncbi:large ribosomal subunit protein mL45 [Lampetra fluviatilis]